MKHERMSLAKQSLLLFL
jgi:von Willebrand factor A domain-containing protein 5